MTAARSTKYLAILFVSILKILDNSKYTWRVLLNYQTISSGARFPDVRTGLEASTTKTRMVSIRI